MKCWRHVQDVVVMQEKYHPSVYSHRNRYMAEHSDRVIAVYDGEEKRRHGQDDPVCTPDEKRSLERSRLGKYFYLSDSIMM